MGRLERAKPFRRQWGEMHLLFKVYRAIRGRSGSRGMQRVEECREKGGEERRGEEKGGRERSADCKQEDVTVDFH